MSSFVKSVANAYLDRAYPNKGSIAVNTTLLTGVVTVSLVKKLLEEPCREDAEKRGLLFIGISKISPPDEEGWREVVYTAELKISE